MNYNVGFVRIEVEDGTEYITDLGGEIFDTFIDLNESAIGCSCLRRLAEHAYLTLNFNLKYFYENFFPLIRDQNSCSSD